MSRPPLLSAAALASASARQLRAIAERAPRIHCITNTAAAAYTANLLLAVGAVPALSLAEEELDDFISRSDALCVNLGTLDAERRRAIAQALDRACTRRLPWVLDPVMVDVAAARRTYAQTLLAYQPTVIRGNAAEIAALAASGTVVQTGAVDRISDGTRTLPLHNGHPLLARVTAVGCAQAALIAAFLTVESDPWLAAAAAVLALNVAGERAAAQAAGPGSLQIALLDELYRLDEATLREYCHLDH